MTNLKIFVREYKSGIVFVILCMIVFFLAGIAYSSFKMEETYTARTSIINRQASSDSDMGVVTNSGSGGVAYLRPMSEGLPYGDYEGYMKSKRLTAKLLEKNGLVEKFAKAYGTKPEDINLNDFWKVVAKGISVKDPGKGILYVEYIGPTQTIASDCANGYVDVFIEFFDIAINADLNATIAFLESNKSDLEVKLAKVDDQIMALKQEHRILDVTQESTHIIDEYAQARMDILKSEVELMGLERALNGINEINVLSPDSKLYVDPVITDLRKKKMLLEMNFKNMSNYFKEDSVELTSLSKQIEDVRRQLKSYAGEELNISKGLKEDQLGFMKQYAGEIENRMFELPTLSDRLFDLERTRAVYEKLHSFLEERLATERLNKSKRISQFVILDRAEDSECRRNSKFSTIPLFGALFGALFGLWVIFLQVKLKDFVRSL